MRITFSWVFCGKVKTRLTSASQSSKVASRQYSKETISRLFFRNKISGLQGTYIGLDIY